MTHPVRTRGVGSTEPPAAKVPALPAPERTCVGCGRKAPQPELLRFTAREGKLVPGRLEPGRGAYTCRRLACFERALASRAFNRVLRRAVSVDPDLSRLYTGQLHD